MKYGQLRAFHAVATHGGFTAAANAINQTQPGVSEQVRRLEQDHDVLLFRREGRQITLTENGVALYALTKQFFEVEDSIAAHLAASAAAVDGHLRIVADAAQHITGPLATFRERHAAVRVSLQVGNTDAVLERLRAYDAEIGVVGRLDPGRDLEVIDLGKTPILAVVGRDGPFGKLKQVQFDTLDLLPLIWREPGSRTRASLEAEASVRGRSLKIAMEVEGREAMREVVAAGAGVGFVSRAELGHDTRLKAIEIVDARLTMPEALVYLKARSDVPVIRAFLQTLRST